MVNDDNFLIVNVGCADFPATPDDIADIKQQFTDMAETGKRILITHHAVSAVLVHFPKSGKVSVKKSKKK